MRILHPRGICYKNVKIPIGYNKITKQFMGDFALGDNWVLKYMTARKFSF